MKKEGCPPGTYRTDDRCKKFSDSDFLSARDKYLVYTKYRSFLDSLKKEYEKPREVHGRIHSAPFFRFHERLYEHLHLECGFIAHNNREGFYHTYFEDPEDTIHFIDHMKKAEEHCNKEFTDINEALAEETKRQAQQLNQAMSMRIKKRDIETARSLLKRHGLKIKGLR